MATVAEASGLLNPVTNVALVAEATRLGTGVTRPYTLSWTEPPPGLHPLTAVAWDTTGMGETSAVVHVNISTSGPPRVTVTSPTDGESRPAFLPLAISAAVTNIPGLVKVEFYVGSERIRQAVSSPFNISLSGLGAGAHSVWAVATDSLDVPVNSQP